MDESHPDAPADQNTGDLYIVTGFYVDALCDILQRTPTQSTIVMSLPRDSAGLTLVAQGSHEWKYNLFLCPDTNFYKPPDSPCSLTLEIPLWSRLLSDERGVWNTLKLQVSQDSATFLYTGSTLSGSVTTSGPSVQIETSRTYEVLFYSDDVRAVGNFLQNESGRGTLGLNDLEDVCAFFIPLELRPLLSLTGKWLRHFKIFSGRN